MKESSIVVTSVNTKLCTSRLLGFINNQNTGISKFECEQCEYKATKKGHLRVHTLSKHGGIFDCDQCECKATIKNHLRVHTLSKRKGIRFDCDQCEYKARQKSQLTVHKQWEHDLTVINLNTKQITKIVSDCTNSQSMKGLNITVTSVSTKQQLKVI